MYPAVLVYFSYADCSFEAGKILIDQRTRGEMAAIEIDGLEVWTGCGSEKFKITFS